MAQSVWTDFEHSIWKKFKENSLTEQNKFILAVSGGIDSVVLATVMRNLKPQGEFIIVYFHHGDDENLEIQNFRDQSAVLVEKLSHQLSMVFVTEKSQIKLNSEEEMRAARFIFFEKIKANNPDFILATGHNQDDQLETWLLKAIRGSGPVAMAGFNFWNKTILRPLLILSRVQITDFAKHNYLKWIEDPTNNETMYLRNWLRNQWLRDLELKKTGAKANLALSLDRLIRNVNPDSKLDTMIDFIYETYEDEDKAKQKNKLSLIKALISRKHFLALSHSEKITILAKTLGPFDVEFSQGQLEEIIKHLDKNQKDLRFKVASVYWFINAQQIMVGLEEFK